MEAENGYEIFSIFHIATRDDDQRCVISDAPRAAQSPPSVFPPASPRARHKMDQLMRWLISLLSFVEATYYTLTKGNYTNKNTTKTSLRMNAVLLDPGGEDAKMNAEMNVEMNAVLLDPGGEDAKMKMNAEMNEMNAVLLDPGGEAAKMKILCENSDLS